MADTSIEWTDKTWNPVTGCTKVSQGCKNCYAERLAPKVFAGQCTCQHFKESHTVSAEEHIGACVCTDCECGGFEQRTFTDVRCHPERLEQPLHWRKPARIFVNSMSDLFHEDVPESFILEVYRRMGAAHWHTYQILTKRPERMNDVLPRISERLQAEGRAPLGPVWKHVWHGVSVEDQPTADKRIPELLRTLAAVRFVSYEPALGQIDIRPEWVVPAETKQQWVGKVSRYDDPNMLRPSLDWVIVGGESGPGARRFETAWARSIVEQCRAAGVACFVKQMGSNPFASVHTYNIPPVVMKLNDRKGGDWNEWPEDLRVRQYPKEL